MIDFIAKGFRRVPLIGALADVRMKDHTEACIELGPSLFLALAPIWLGAFLLLPWQGAKHSLIELIYHNVNSGEFCLYATATLGPLYYFIFKDYKEAAGKQFPSGRSFMLVAAVVLLLSSGLFAIQKALETTQFNPKALDHAFIFNMSWTLYAVAVLIVYLAHVYKNFFESGGPSLERRATQDFVNDFNRRPRDPP